jgi:carboxypeptidase Q
VKAEAVVVTDFNQLGENVRGKIVVYNQKWNNYADSVKYRSQGAEKASAFGAVAALVRSITS